LQEWLLFEEDFGPLTLHERIDAMSAQIAYVVHASAGGTMRPEEFQRRWVARRPLDDDGVVSFFSGLAKKAAS